MLQVCPLSKTISSMQNSRLISIPRYNAGELEGMEGKKLVKVSHDAKKQHDAMGKFLGTHWWVLPVVLVGALVAALLAFKGKGKEKEKSTTTDHEPEEFSRFEDEDDSVAPEPPSRAVAMVRVGDATKDDDDNDATTTAVAVAAATNDEGAGSVAL